MNTIQEIKFIIDLSGAEHVENLHPYKHVENKSQVSWWCNSFVFWVTWFQIPSERFTVKNVAICLHKGGKWSGHTFLLFDKFRSDKYKEK